MSISFKTVKTTLTASVIATALLCTQVFANENVNSDKQAKQQHRLERLIDKLELPESQVTEFTEIMNAKAQLKEKKRAHKKEINELIDTGYTDQAAESAAAFAREHIYAIATQKQRLKALLTPEQLDTLRSLKKKKRHHKKHHKGPKATSTQAQ